MTENTTEKAPKKSRRQSSKKNGKDDLQRESIDALRDRIHELYKSAEGARAHLSEIERLHHELTERMAERPEVIDDK